jgi:shikimate 5-dehydrogenase
VTAPLKGLARAVCAQVTPTARDLDAVNTLRFDERESRWHGANTDREGFEALRPAAGEARSVAVWGGGGTRTMLGEVLPAAAFHAARTGAHTGGPPVASPEVVVWATGRPGATPPSAWRPAQVIDLDYREDAPGRAYALAVGARYTSGLAMFTRQAAAQRAWWESFENRVC